MRGARALFTADGEELAAGPGDIIVVSTDTPHMFKSMGPERLDMACIHDSPTMIQENLE